MDFEEYLASKKINSVAYKASEPMQWAKFAAIFEQMHPKSFTMQKLNLINGLRRQFPYIEEEEKQEVAKPRMARPMMKPKTQSPGGKPVIKPKISVAKPKMSKPVIKPKVNANQDNKEVAKPKMARPIIKSKSKKSTD